MFTEMERDYFERFIQSQFDNVHSKLDAQIHLQKIANGRTHKLEDEVEKLNQWRAASQGHYRGIILVCTVLGFIIGIVSVYLWH